MAEPDQTYGTAAPGKAGASSWPDEQLLREVIDLVRGIDGGESGPSDISAYDIISYEEQVCHCVRTGDVESVLRMDVPGKSAPVAGVSPVLHLKCLLVALNAQCLHAAIDGGISTRMGYGLNSQLSTHIMTCATEDELLELVGSKVIPLSYCLLVRELSVPAVFDKDILRVIRYIHDHHHERITVGELAKHVGLSPEYLSAKFRRETGMTVSGYLSEARIREAKVLLRFSSLSIGEIAAQLSFSSQSYFRTAFKRKVGVTPQQYRNAAGEDGTKCLRFPNNSFAGCNTVR